MIADLNETERSELAGYDLCVIGTGPAGTTLVNELVGSGLKVCVLESGLARTTPRGDRLRVVDSEGIHVKDYSRERVLGGASTTWAGLSSPLDPIDFEDRPFLQRGGWPIAPDELTRYYRAAAERYRFPTLETFEAEGFPALKRGGALEPEWDELEEKVFLACAEPQNFGREFRAAFEAEGVELWLDATVVRLEADAAGVQAALVRTRSGRELRARARCFVLATGGIENARLLLASRDACPAGLGNEHDQVGRYLMNHPKNYHGILHLARPVGELPYYFGCLHKGFAGYAGLRLRQDLQRRRELLNSYVRFEPLFPWSDNEGVESLVLFVKRSQFFFSSWKKRHEDEVVTLRDYSETGDDDDLQNERKSPLAWLGLAFKVLLNMPSVLHYLYYRLRRRAKPMIRRVRLRNFMEMEPEPENRVVLGETLDENGAPRALVRHRCTELDRRSLVALHEVLAAEFERAGVGRLETRLGEEQPWPITLDASHHMGTTRMGDDPRSSVVDRNLKLHGVDNLYAAGASVFPTSGCANPTMTLVALSIRLAETLRARLGAAEAGAR